MKTPRYYIRKWLGIEDIQMQLDLRPTPDFVNLRFRGHPVGTVAKEDVEVVTSALIKGYEHK